MAFFEQEDEEQQDPNNQSFQTSAPAGVVGATGAVGQGSGGPAPKAAGSPDSGSNFVGIQQYLNANKPQAEKLGNQVSGVINQSADQARTGVNQLNQEASQKIQGTQNLSDEVKNKVQNSAETLSPEERETVKRTQTATYRGPQAATDLQSYQAAADASNRVKTNIENSGTEQGRMNLISQVNNKSRTQGMNVFDNALLQSGGGREKLAQASSANQDVLGGLTNAQTNIQNQIGRADDPNTPDVDESSGAIGQTNKAQSDAYKSVQDALNAWKSGFEPKVQQAQNAYSQAQQAAVNDIADNPLVLDPETLSLFKNVIGSGQSIYGLDLNNYLNPGSPTDINAGNVASGIDYARYGALADLAGDTSNYLDPANVSQAGTAPQLSANFTQLRSDIDSAKNAYNTAYQNTRGGFLNSAYLPSYLSYDPQIANATPQEIMDQWIPYYQNRIDNPNFNGANPTLDAQTRDALLGSVNDFKRNQGFFNVVRPSSIPYPEGDLDWRNIPSPTGGAGKEPPPIYNPNDEIFKNKGKS